MAGVPGNTPVINSGSLLHRENRENGPKNSLQGKHRELRNFAKTQGVLFAQVVNSLIIKMEDISIFATKYSIFSKSALLMKLLKFLKFGQVKFLVG